MSIFFCILLIIWGFWKHSNLRAFLFFKNYLEYQDSCVYTFVSSILSSREAHEANTQYNCQLFDSVVEMHDWYWRSEAVHKLHKHVLLTFSKRRNTPSYLTELVCTHASDSLSCYQNSLLLVEMWSSGFWDHSPKAWVAS